MRIKTALACQTPVFSKKLSQTKFACLNNKSTRKLKRKNLLQQISFLTSVLDLNFSFKSEVSKEMLLI